MPQESPPLDAAQAQASQAKRMEIVGRLTGGIVHDFNNILTVITGTIEILAEAVADRPELATITQLITEAAARGAGLTSHLLAFARDQPSQPRDVDLNALLGEAARLLRPTLGEQIAIHSIPAAGVAPARVDPSQLMTAILNLAIIARDAMPDGGNLSFGLRDSSPDENGIGGDGDGDGSAAHHVVVAVNAFGHGISAARQGEIFADLGAVRNVIERCNGHIKICNGSDRGTSAEIHLSRSANTAAASMRDSGKPCIEGGDEAILVVEDDALVRRYVIAQVQSLGYRTFAADNANGAMAIIEGGEKIDLLFTDVVMPGGINGRQLVIEALGRRPSLKTLYTSGYPEDVMVRSGYLDAGVMLLKKPYRKADLAKMIRAAMSA